VDHSVGPIGHASFLILLPAMRTSFLVVAGAVVAVTSGTATAQRLLAYDPLAGAVAELQPPDAVLFAPNPPVLIYPSAPILPPPPVVGLPAPGDSTFDNVGGVHWFTNGAILAAMPSPSVPPLVPLMPPMPIPPGLMGAIGGPVTGIAVDPAAGIMFMSSIPGIIIGVAPVPGLPVVVPPFPMPFPPAPIAGLEWDGATGTLWAVDIAGIAYNFFPGGAPAGPPLAPAFPPPGPVGDIAIDKMAKINPVGLRPLYVTAGGMVYDMNDPGALPFPSGPPAEGLAFANHPIQVGPFGGCATCPSIPGGGPTNFITGPMTSGNAAFGLGMTGLLPLSFCVFGFDTVYNPLIPMLNLAGCPLGLTISPTLLLFVAPTDATGTAVFPIPLAGVPVGATLYNQGFAFCAADPTGFVFSPFQSLTIGGL
tara:strand:- start:49845 stop:51110 length:1266 start_codon:yes stop_codon:yes gene_type:complete